MITLRELSKSRDDLRELEPAHRVKVVEVEDEYFFEFHVEQQKVGFCQDCEDADSYAEEEGLDKEGCGGSYCTADGRTVFMGQDCHSKRRDICDSISKHNKKCVVVMDMEQVEEAIAKLGETGIEQDISDHFVLIDRPKDSDLRSVEESIFFQDRYTHIGMLR